MTTPTSKLILMEVLVILPASLSTLAQNNVEEFKEGMENLKKEAQNYTFKENNFNSNLQVQDDPEHYDFVIIGVGAAGAVIANRLSAHLHHNILLLEAGGPETPYTQVPNLVNLLQNTDYNWGFVTTPQNNTCGGMVDNKCTLASGKALGGGTAINAMYCTRGNSENYNQWADMGNEGWSYSDLLPYFKRLEDAFLKPLDPEYRHRGGPFHIEHPQYWTEITDSSLAAGKELGFDTIDFNAKHQLGMGRTQLSTKRGKRQSTAQAYLVPVRKRSNLTIKPFSQVTKILINAGTKDAEGVEYLQNGKLYTAKADKEIILSAGTVNTAQLLKLSGIGPTKELNKFDIPVIAELNVGTNFKDQVSFQGLSMIFNETEAEDGDITDEIIQYLKQGKGPLTVPGSETVAFYKTENSKSQVYYPDIEFLFRRERPSPSARMKPNIFESLYQNLGSKKILHIEVTLLHIQSTGSVLLKDKDPLHHPLIDVNSLSDPDNEDFHTLLAGIKKGVDFANSEAFRKLGLMINNNKVAGCEDHEWGSDDYWKCSIKLLTNSLHHVTGTARMGPKWDKDAVVDNNLKVYGVQKLRVADASVIPVTISGHTMIPSVMIGEKASDLILNSWNKVKLWSSSRK